MSTKEHIFAYNSFTWGNVQRFHLYGYGLLRFNDEYADYKSTSSNLSLLEGIIDAELDSWFKHPYLFQYHIGLGGYETLRLREESSGNTFTGLYNIWFTLYPLGSYTLGAYTRRNISYITEKYLPSTRIYNDSFGGSFGLKKTEYPDIIIRYDTTHYYTDLQNVSSERNVRYTTLGAGVSKPYGRNFFSGLYELRNQKDNVSNFSYLEHYFNLYNNSYFTDKTLFSLYFTDIKRSGKTGTSELGETNTVNTSARLFYRPSRKQSHAFNLTANNGRGNDSYSDSNSFVYDFEYYLMNSLRTIDSVTIQRSYTLSGANVYHEWKHSANIGAQLIQPYRYTQLRSSYFISPSIIDREDENPGTSLGNSASFGLSFLAIPVITLSSDATYSTMRSQLSWIANSEERKIETRITNRTVSRWRFEGISTYDWKKTNDKVTAISRTENFSNTLYIDRYFRRLMSGLACGYTIAHQNSIGSYRSWFIETRLSGRLTRRVNASISAQHTESAKDNEFESLWYEQAEVNYVNRLLTIAFQFIGTQRLHQYNLNTFLLTIRRDFNEYF